jgi:hypothetical protein
VPFLGDDLQNHRRDEERRGLLLGRGELRAHGIRPGLLDAAELDLMAEVDVDESRRPLPHRVAGPHAEDARNRVADRKAALLEQAHHGGAMFGSPPESRQLCSTCAHEFAHERTRGRDAQAVVLDVLVEDRDAARADDGRELVDEERGRGDEAGDPAAPARIHAACWQRIRHQVEFVILDVVEPVAREHRAAGLDESRRALDGHDLTCRADDLREIRRREAGAGADVEHLRAGPMPARRQQSSTVGRQTPCCRPRRSISSSCVPRKYVRSAATRATSPCVIGRTGPRRSRS